jgi:DNA invertase Pin-like site-specific DNA recombinase
MEGKFVAYYRVSTDHQSIEGNGIFAQRRAVEDYLNGGRWKLIAEFTEVESGKRNNRPEPERALAACKKHKAKLIIAKLDRLSRNVHFISGLMERKVDFVACDMPSANAFMINVYAAVTQEERRMISERTKAGLRAARQRGVVLGSPGATCTQCGATGSRRRPRAGHRRCAGRVSVLVCARRCPRAQCSAGADAFGTALVGEDCDPSARTIGDFLTTSTNCGMVSPMSDDDLNLARCRHVVTLQMAEIEVLRHHVAALQKAIDKEIGGAHAELIRQYTDPKLSSAARRAAALPFEKSKPLSVTATVDTRSLFSILEERRLAKRVETTKVITATAADPSPAA